MVAACLAWPAQATIQEQRARLPPPAECQDTVAGRWKSHQYDPRFDDWTVFVLDVHRSQGDDTRLEGTIETHHWEGGPFREEPGPCQAGLPEWRVSMDAEGTVSDTGEIRFWGVGAWRVDQVLCNQGPGGYNLDHFSGQLDGERQEFQTLNNDGGRAVNEPTLFRRISCHPPPGQESPRLIRRPPPFYPTVDRGGCQFF